MFFESATFSRCDGASVADRLQPVGVEKLLDLRVTEAHDPASFWAQIREGGPKIKVSVKLCGAKLLPQTNLSLVGSELGVSVRV